MNKRKALKRKREIRSKEAIALLSSLYTPNNIPNMYSQKLFKENITLLKSGKKNINNSKKRKKAQQNKDFLYECNAGAYKCTRYIPIKSQVKRYKPFSLT